MNENDNTSLRLNDDSIISFDENFQCVYVKNVWEFPFDLYGIRPQWLDLSEFPPMPKNNKNSLASRLSILKKNPSSTENKEKTNVNEEQRFEENEHNDVISDITDVVCTFGKPRGFEVNINYNQVFSQKIQSAFIKLSPKYVKNQQRYITCSIKGLKNPGSYCYVHVILQALSCSTLLQNTLEEIFLIFEKEGNQTEYLRFLKKNCPTLHCLFVFLEWQTGNGSLYNITLNDIKNLTNEHFYRILPAGQQDAAEFLDALLSKIDEEIVKLIPQDNTENSSKSAWKLKNIDYLETADHIDTPIRKLFQGSTQFLFHSDNKIKRTIEPFYMLRLNVSNGMRSIYDSFQQFIQQQSNTQNLINSLPLVLIICLNRLYYDRFEGCIKKNQTNIDVPMELTIGDECLVSNNTLKYDLISAIYHVGTQVNRGHYYVQSVRKINSDIVVYHVDGEKICELDKAKNRGDSFLLMYSRKNH
eukprot:TRINITY_DN1845_c0_g1_i1.p1 TRINITY_DN1845_c0_g1~~TRINITY_DN1845_c0_g1_i1.p1  ORF type:complete len:472 (-),score=87.89 TRINITY_DN1845_c0_g1_i1:43-1458(-)